MIYKTTKLGVLDNTGVKRVKVLQIYKAKQAKAGDYVLTVIRKKKKAKEFVKKKIYYVFVVAHKKPIFRIRGSYYLKLLYNRAILLGADNEKILGTRHNAFLTLESRKKAFSQLLRSCKVLV